MALALGIKANNRIMIGDQILRVINVSTDGRTIVIEILGKTHTITDAERVEVMPNVFVSCGVYDGVVTEYPDRNGVMRGPYSRLTFEAPRAVRISRMRGNHGHPL